MGDNYRNTNHHHSPLLLGDNYFATVTLTVPNQTSILPGEILEKKDGKFVSARHPYTGNLAVLVEEQTNRTNNPVDVSVRVMVSGRINRQKLTVSGNAATEDQADGLRNWGILPLKVNEIGMLDNA